MRAPGHRVAQSRMRLGLNSFDKDLKPTAVELARLYSKKKPGNDRYWPTTGPSWISNGYAVSFVDTCGDHRPALPA